MGWALHFPPSSVPGKGKGELGLCVSFPQRLLSGGSASYVLLHVPWNPFSFYDCVISGWEGEGREGDIGKGREGEGRGGKGRGHREGKGTSGRSPRPDVLV